MTGAEFVLPLFSLVVAVRARAVGEWLGVMDYPSLRPERRHKTHLRPTPLVGGVAVALPVLTICVLQMLRSPGSPVHVALAIPIAGAFLVGFFDDRRSLPSLFRLFYGVVLALVGIVMLPAFVVAQFDFTFLAAPVPLGPLAVAFSVLVIAGMMNAVNMTDGMNGLACGLCLIWSVFLLFHAPAEVAAVVLVLALCLCVALVFNLAGNLFLGDAGTYACGLAISLLTVYAYNTPSEAGGATLHADAVVAWFLIPVLDCLRLMATRASRGRSPLSPDTDHLHHRLLRVLPKPAVLLAYWALVAAPGAVAIARPSWTAAAILTAAVVYLALLAATSERVIALATRRAALAWLR